jgi:hypothetical protein
MILFLIFLLVTPAAQIGVSWARRRGARTTLERERGTRVVGVVLSMGTVATYGVPIARFEQLPLPEETAAAIAAAPPDRPLDVVVDMPAGLRYDPAPVAEAIAGRAAQTTVVVPRRALSGGLTLVGAAGRVLLGESATVADRVGGGHEVPAPAGDRPSCTREPVLDASGLQGLGIDAEEGVPDEFFCYLDRLAGPRPPRRWFPFLIRVPRDAA